MSFRVGESQRGAPRSAEYEPPLDSEMLAQFLHVFDEMPRGVVHEAGVGPALAAATLVEQDDAIALGIEEAAHLGIGAAAGTAVNKHGRLAPRIAALLVVDLVDFRDSQEAGAIGLYGWIERAQLLRSGGGFALRSCGSDGAHALFDRRLRATDDTTFGCHVVSYRGGPRAHTPGGGARERGAPRASQPLARPGACSTGSHCRGVRLDLERHRHTREVPTPRSKLRRAHTYTRPIADLVLLIEQVDHVKPDRQCILSLVHARDVECVAHA